MALYKVKAKVLIEIETVFDDTEEPTADTIKWCVDEDISAEQSIAGAIDDCEVIEFECNLCEVREEKCENENI